MFTKTRDGKLYYEIPENFNDDTKPILIIVPGGPGLTLETYKPHFSCLSQQYRVIFFDQRGCGHSTGFPTNSMTIYQNIDDIECLRKALGIEKIVLLGISYGAMVTYGYAANYSDTLSGLITIAGSPTYRFLQTAKKNLLAVGTAEQIRYADEVLWPGKFSTPESIGEFFSTMGSLYSMKNKVISSEQPKPITGSVEPLNFAFSSDFWKFDFTEKLCEVSCPALIMVGSRDWINDKQYSKLAANCLRNSTLIVYENCGHSLMTDVPEQTMLEIGRFSEKCSCEKGFRSAL